LFYIIVKFIFLIFFKFFFRLKISGQKNIPQDGPFIIVANHSSVLDPVILGVSVKPKVIFIAAAYLFEIHWLGYLLRKANSISIHRENYAENIESIKQALKILQKGGVLGIFPEGGVDRQKNNLPIKAGAAFLATSVGIPIVPIRIKGADKALPRGEKFFRSLNKIEVEIKKPIFCSRHTNKNKEIVERVVESFTKEIY